MSQPTSESGTRKLFVLASAQVDHFLSKQIPTPGKLLGIFSTYDMNEIVIQDAARR